MLQFTNAVAGDYSVYEPRLLCTIAGAAPDSQTEDGAVALIRGLLTGEVREIRLQANQVNTGIALAQSIDAAVGTIDDRLTEMMNLADQAAHGHNTDADRLLLEQQFQTLAGQIDSIVEGTAYDGNRLFTSAGATISIPEGPGQTTLIFARNFSFGLSALSLADAPGEALNAVLSAKERVSEYRRDVAAKLGRLQAAMERLEGTFGRALDIDTGAFNTTHTRMLCRRVAEQISRQGFAATAAQAGTAGETARVLLSYRPTALGEA